MEKIFKNSIMKTEKSRKQETERRKIPAELTIHPFFRRQSPPFCTPEVGINPLSTYFENCLHPSTCQEIKILTE